MGQRGHQEGTERECRRNCAWQVPHLDRPLTLLRPRHAAPKRSRSPELPVDGRYAALADRPNRTISVIFASDATILVPSRYISPLMFSLGGQETRMRESPATRSNSDPDSSDALELALVVAIARGDRKAFEKLYTRYHGLLTRFLIRSTSRRDLVEEVVNETMWGVWRGASRFRGDSKPRSWVISIAYRCLMKALRDRPLDPRVSSLNREDAGPMGDIPEASNDIAQAELRDWVRHGLDLLPTEQRTTIELAYFLGQSCEEIAGIMNCAVGTVKARMFHARVRLRNTLPTLGGEGDDSHRSEPT